MDSYSILRLKIKPNHLLASFCFLSIFIFCCVRFFSARQEKVLTQFFEELLLEHGGAYTLLGSKPATIEDLMDLSDENYQKLQEHLKAHPEILSFAVDRHLEEGWKILKKKPFSLSDRFILTEINHENSHFLVFLNKELVVRSMKENHSEFERFFRIDFDPLLEIEQLRTGNHSLWAHVFNDFVCQGILLGYGPNNARIFNKLYKERKIGNSEETYPVSENNDPRIQAECYLNERPFRIPIFVMFDQKESQKLVIAYKSERENILKFYDKKNFLDTTLSLLIKD